MKIQSICLITGLALAAAMPASAQSNDAAYCNALIGEYQHYLGGSGSGKHTDIDQNATARVAINKCKAGDFSGIPVLEQELRNAKLELPPRG
jgi:hypothetical protein